MPKYYFEVVAHGRTNLAIEADSAEHAEELIENADGFPDFDKLYELNVNLIGSDE